jgi:hypothetical protein
VNQLNFIGQELIDAVADDGVRLSAADFHDGPVARGRTTDLFGQALCFLAVAEFS